MQLIGKFHTPAARGVALLQLPTQWKYFPREGEREGGREREGANEWVRQSVLLWSDSTLSCLTSPFLAQIKDLCNYKLYPLIYARQCLPILTVLVAHICHRSCDMYQLFFCGCNQNIKWKSIPSQDSSPADTMIACSLLDNLCLQSKCNDWLTDSLTASLVWPGRLWLTTAATPQR